MLARRGWHRGLADVASSLAVGVLFLSTLELFARVFLHDGNEHLNPNFVAELHGWVEKPSDIPSLCRWDCAWYLNMATSGYPGKDGPAASNTAFFPLYGMLMRWGGALFHVNPAYAGLWVTRICIPFNVWLLRDFVRLSGNPEPEAGWAVVAVFLISPVGYNLGAALPEALFVFFTLATIVLARRGHLYFAMVPAFCAGLTRVHAFAFLLGLAAFGLASALSVQRRRARVEAFLPFVGCALAIGSLLTYFQITLHDPLAFIHAQQFFGKPTFDLAHVAHEVAFYAKLTPPSDPNELLDWLRLPAGMAICASPVYFVVKRRWFEAAYTAGLAGMVLLSSFWGVLRYVALVFPVCVLIAELRRWRGVFYSYLVFCAAFQTYAFMQFTLLRRGE
jgi:hypothetical protein